MAEMEVLGKSAPAFAEALRDTVVVLNSTLDPETVLDHILANVGCIAPYDVADILLIEAGVAHVARSWNYAKQAPEETIQTFHFSVADTPNLRHMVERGQPLAISDTRTYPGWIKRPAAAWLRSWASAPIRREGRVIGFLNLSSSTPGFYTAAHAERLQIFADQAAIALENARLHSQANRRARELAALNRAGRMMASTLELDIILEQTMREVKALLEAEGASVLLHDPASDELVFAAVADPGPEQLVGRRMPLTTGFAGWVMRERRPVWVDQARRDPRFYGQIDALTGLNTRSLIAVPLIFEETLIGVVEVINKVRGAFDVHDLELLESLSHFAALAIKNARLFEQVQGYAAELEQRVADRTRELAALYDVAAVANEALDLPTTLERSLERVSEAMRSQAGSIHLLNETGEILHRIVQKDLPPDLAAQLETLPVARGLLRGVIQSGDPAIVPDMSLDPRLGTTVRLRFQTYAGVPIRARGRMLGVLSVFRSRGQPPFKVEEVALLTTIADQVGVVVESARLRQLAEQSAVMAERARLARDLHDSVTQLLYSVNLFAAAGRDAYQQEDMADVGNSLTEVELIAQQALKEMRLLVYELRPSALAQEGLLGAVQQRLEAVERRASVQAQLQGNITIDLPPGIEEALYHIIQEALNNTLKHAAATAVTVRLETSGRRIELEVTDNGLGFDPHTLADPGGLGLTSMRERVENLGGTLTLRSKPGEGTTVRVNLEIA